MILVDSSVWIDQLARRETAQTLAFERLLIAEQEIGVGDLIMMEVLQGTRDEHAFDAAMAHLWPLIASRFAITGSQKRLPATTAIFGPTVLPFVRPSTC